MSSLKSEYSELMRLFEIAKEWWAKNEDNISKDTIKKITRSREQFHQFFKKSLCFEVCKTCKGFCCKDEEFRPKMQEVLSIFYQLIYLAVINYIFPEPDWRFLGEEPQSCLFLLKEGCLLKENRPYICLNHVCGFLENKMELSDENLDRRYKELREDLISALKEFITEVEKLGGLKEPLFYLNPYRV